MIVGIQFYRYKTAMSATRVDIVRENKQFTRRLHMYQSPSFSNLSRLTEHINAGLMNGQGVVRVYHNGWSWRPS